MNSVISSIAAREKPGKRTKMEPQRMFVLGVRVDNITTEFALSIVGNYAAPRNRFTPRQAGKVFFMNVHTICLGQKDREFMSCVNHADAVLPDGNGLAFAGRILGKPIKENLNGTDFTPKVLRKAQLHGWTVFLFGSRPEVIVRCVLHLRRQFPWLKVIGFRPGYFSMDDEETIINEINAKSPDILLVALGSPFQEKWISRNAHRLNVGVCMAVGGLFDFVSGTKRRAPLWMRKLGIEWLYRFMQDPWSKWTRVFVEIPFFLTLVIGKRLIPRRVQSFIRRMRLFHG